MTGHTYPAQRTPTSPTWRASVLGPQDRLPPGQVRGAGLLPARPQARRPSDGRGRGLAVGLVWGRFLALTGLGLATVLGLAVEVESVGPATASGFAGEANAGAAAIEAHPLPELLARDRTPPSRGQPASGGGVVPGQVLVKLRKGSATALALHRARDGGRTGLATLRATTPLGPVLTRHDAQDLEAIFSVRGPNVALARATSAIEERAYAQKRQELERWYRLRVAPEADVGALAEELRGEPDVECVEPSYEWRLAGTIPPPISGLPDGTTDPDYDKQWHHTNAKIAKAWNFLKESGVHPGGSPDVVVAVIDSGIDYHHEDLVGNLWTNPREIPANGVDDDGNGFVDDVYGCSVVSDPRSHGGDPVDYHGHGTHVAGIIAAQGYNHLGGVGVAFNSKIMAIRAAQYSGVLTTDDIAEGVIYAVDQGAEVINMSFGGYQYSQVMTDTLAAALSRAILVAAAGNDSLPADGAPHYPAALPWVLGVEASTPEDKLAWFSNADTQRDTRFEYEIRAPGVSIYSTLPGQAYAAWSGTSMTSPVVSGIAALMRAFFWQREVYSSRFLMGSIAASCHGGVVDAYLALTEPPTPGVSLLENWLFDSKAIATGNDADGRADSGETLHLAVELINRAGLSSNVVATLRAQAPGAALPDPYIALLTDTVDFGSIGPFATADNGFVYDHQGVIVGAQRPFVFRVDPNCPNDHVIPFVLTITFRDGWNPDNPDLYTRVSRFEYVVQRGKNLPRVISQDMTLTADEFWMVGGPVLVEPAATLTIAPGTLVQWGAISDDPYNPGPQSGYIIVRGRLLAQGTVANPVTLFPSYLVAGQTTTITADQGGVVDLQYAKIRNPALTGVRSLDHCYLDWDSYGATVSATEVSHSIFHRLRGGPPYLEADRFVTCLFDASWMPPKPQAQMYNCTVLQDEESPLRIKPPCTLRVDLTTQFPDRKPRFLELRQAGGFTYALMPLEWPSLDVAELIANYYGGHLASVPDAATETWLQNYIAPLPRLMHSYHFVIGLTDEGPAGALTGWRWLDGTPLNHQNWAQGYPQGSVHALTYLVNFAFHDGNGVGFGWRNLIEQSGSRHGTGRHDWRLFVLRLPGQKTLEELVAPFESGTMLDHVRTHHRERVRYNAFLNRYWDPNLATWLRVQAPANTPRGIVSLQDNYWGTDSKTLIDHLILDYYDDFTSARIDYGEPPAQGYPTTYPFVQEVLINGQSARTVPVLGAGPARFRITFNRDMDPQIEPFVTFGPSAPYTDFLVEPRDDNYLRLGSGWLDARTWEGLFWITPVTGEAYHLMRISGAVAADDPWLVSGYDIARFRFRVQTMGVAAMTLQADGREGGILLSWRQNDYDLLAGYNLYRAETVEGPYTRLNATVIPPGDETYLDTGVPPAVPRFYKFTVLTTDFSESESSNVASAAAVDTIPPVLTHAAVTEALPGRGLRLTAIVTDNVAVQEVSAYYHYRPSGTATYTRLALVNLGANNWSATVPGNAVQPPALEYYLEASDGLSKVLSGSPILPHAVRVSDVPTLASVTPNRGPAGGGTPVSVSGHRFESGCSVLFGSALAGEITVLAPNQLTCVTPPHFPAQVDVTIINPGGSRSTLLNGYRFESTDTVVSLPDTTGDFGTEVELALSVANVTGLRAADVTLAFDPQVLTAQNAQLGALTAGWALAANLNTPGRIQLSLASPVTVSGNGTLALLRFQVIARPPATSALTLERAVLNDGAMTVTRSDGRLAVSGLFALSGAVRYFVDDRPVPGVTLDLAGGNARSALTGPEGRFAFSEVPTGSYNLTPRKADHANEITAYDAALVLQAAAGLLNLTAAQVLAADVNRNGTVSGMDAAYILEYAVGLIAGPFPGAGRVWDFTPATRSYALFNADQTGQDFTAVLIGDVSGNWALPVGGLASHGRDLEGVGSAPSANAPEPVVVAVDQGVPSGESAPTVRVLLRALEPLVYGADVVLTYTPTDREVAEVRVGSLGQALALAANTREPGVVRAALASAAPVVGNGPLLVVRFAGSGPVAGTVARVRLNEDQIAAALHLDLASFDTDGDGLIDADELDVFRTDPGQSDTDSDRSSDGDEARAGTNPLAAESVLAIRSVTPQSPRGWHIEWQSVPGKRYQLEYRDGLEGPTWHAAGSPQMAGAERTAITDDTAPSSGSRYYRVRLVTP